MTDWNDYGPSKRTLGSKFLDFDIFGQQVTFSIRGRDKFNTYLGACLSLTLITILSVSALLSATRAFIASEVSDIQQLQMPGYFSMEDVINFNSYDVDFAIGLSSTTKFEYQSRETFE